MSLPDRRCPHARKCGEWAMTKGERAGESWEIFACTFRLPSGRPKCGYSVRQISKPLEPPHAG